MDKILFVDCDGTIRRTKSGAKYINDPNDQEPIEGAMEALDRARELGYKILGCTNQRGVEAGYKSLNDAIFEQNRTLEIFPQIAAIAFCPDSGNTVYTVWRTGYWEASLKYPRLKGSYRKPGDGMIQLALLSSESHPDDCLFIGDRAEDEAAANAAEVSFIWADTWRQAALRPQAEGKILYQY